MKEVIIINNHTVVVDREVADEIKRLRLTVEQCLNLLKSAKDRSWWLRYKSNEKLSVVD